MKLLKFWLYEQCKGIWSSLTRKTPDVYTWNDVFTFWFSRPPYSICNLCDPFYRIIRFSFICDIIFRKYWNWWFQLRMEELESSPTFITLLEYAYQFKFRKATRPHITLAQKAYFNTISVFNLIVHNLKWVIIALIVSCVYFLISIFYIQIDFTKQIAVWYLTAISYFLLISTFNSFLIKYKYGKFTSAIQRFWKRTGIVFWLIEAFLFLLFFYYFLNSSQEPLYMFDYANLNQEYLIQLKSSYKSLILLSMALYLSYLLMFNLNFLQYTQNIILMFFILLIIFYSLYAETYQFIYVITLFSDKIWVFEEISQSWSLEFEQNSVRVKQHYFVLCLIAKYWHFIFIFVSWFFFFIKSLELKKISYTLIGYNTQNLLILYILNLMCLIQWTKCYFKKFLEITYYWFHMQYDEKLVNQFFVEVINVIKSVFRLESTVLNDLKNTAIQSYSLFTSDNLDLWKFIY